MEDRLAVSEIFGPTFQGEGPSAGRRCGFVRLGHCNLHCSWCDADYTWRFSESLPAGYTGKVFDPYEELRWLSPRMIAEQIEAMHVGMVVVTGGEPLVQQKRLPPLLDMLDRAGYRIEMETNGTLAPTPEIAAKVHRFNVSPKLANSGNALAERRFPAALHALDLTRKAIFKFVVVGPDDLAEIEEIVALLRLDPPSVWLMPEGCNTASVERHAQSVAAAALERGWNLTMRTQVALWGDRRGV